MPASAVHTAATADAGIRVLGSPALWHVVTSFMSGYPRVVCQFLRDHSKSAVGTSTHAQRHSHHHFQPHVHTATAGSYCETTGELPCLAITANDVAMLRTLYALSKHPQYTHDSRLDFASAARCAVLHDRVEVLQCIAELTADDTKWQWDPSLLRTALRRDTPHLRVLEWLATHLPQRATAVDAHDVVFHSRRGNLAVVRWLVQARGCSVSQTALDDAAQRGHVHVLQYLLQHTSLRCRAEAVDAAVEHDHVAVVQLVVASQPVKIGRRAVHAVIQRHRLAMLQFLVEQRVPLDAQHLLDHAAYCGHLEIVKYLHSSPFASSCTVQAMTKAAVCGHIDTVRFLHEHRTEGCRPETLEWAAESGHLDVVEFLCQHRSEGDIERALRCAARMDRSEVAAFLCEHSPGLDVQAALTDARMFVSARALKVLVAHAKWKQQACESAAASDAPARFFERIAGVA